MIRILKELEDYQLEELYSNKLFVNQYGLDLMYDYELNRFWKEFAFDLINSLKEKNIYMVYGNDKSDLLNFIKNNYKIIIERYNLKIDFRDYVELNDYLSIQDWLKDDNHKIICFDGKYHLMQIEKI